MSKKTIKDQKIFLVLVLTIFLESFTRNFLELYFTGFNSCTDKLIVNTLISTGYNLLPGIIPLIFLRKSLKPYFIAYISLLSISNLIDFTHLLQYKTPVTMGAFAVIFETNPQEASEFLKFYNWVDILTILALAFYPLVIFIYYSPNKPFQRISIIKQGILVFLFSTVLAGVQGTISSGNWKYKHHSFEHSNIYNDAKRIFYYLREKHKLNSLRDMRKQIKISANQPHTIDTLKQTYVLVIGESMSKYHLSLYGYNRKTTPILDTLSNLYTFTNVHAPATQTRTVIMMLLTKANVKNIDEYYHSESVINIANAAGFNTSWISNQMQFGISDTETSVLAMDADNAIFINTDWHTNSLDEKILPDYKKILNEDYKKKFIIVHLLGSHFDYYKRYPLNDSSYHLKLFNGYPDHIVSNKQKETIDHYDNSILYTNHILYELIKPLVNLKNPAALIYLSDHGEEVFDRPGMGTGHGSPKLTKEAVDVPFLLWMNSKYEKLNKGFNHSIKSEYLNRNYSSQDLFYTLIDMMKINYKQFDESKSIINDNFKTDSIYILNSANKIVPYENIED